MAALSQDSIKSILIDTVLLVLTIIFLSLRLIRKRNALGLEDWLLCIAMLILILGDIGDCLGELRSFRNATRTANETNTVVTKGGEGVSITTLNPEQVAWFYKVGNRSTSMASYDDRELHRGSI